MASVGMGFTLIHRRVLEALQKAKPKHRWAWFGHDEVVDENGFIDCMGEDPTFCMRAKALGFKIQGHSGIAVGHKKTTLLTWESFDLDVARRTIEANRVKESA